MERPLFRPEVLQARQSDWLGGISLVQPLRAWVFAMAAVGAVVAILAVMLIGEFNRRARVEGRLVPDLGLSTVVAPADGVVVRLMQHEGRRVGRGEGLLLITASRTTEAGLDAAVGIRRQLETRRDSTHRLGSMQAGQLQLQADGLSRQLTAARRELVQIESQVAGKLAQVRIAEEITDRYERIEDRRYVSRVQVAQQQQAVLALRGEQKAMERQAIAMRREIDRLQDAMRELTVQKSIVRATTVREVAALEQERVQQDAMGNMMLKAPVAGLVANAMVEAGQAVRAGQPLVSLLPDGSRLQARLLVPSHAIGFIEAGDEVLLRYQAFPYQKFGHARGTVVRVSKSPVMGEDAPSMYRVTVALERQTILAYGKAEPLRPGMLLEADILGERRKLYEWLFEPLYSLSGTI